MTTTTTFQSFRAKFEGAVVTVTAVNGGWSTITLQNQATRKVRNGALTRLTAEEEAALNQPQDKAEPESGAASKTAVGAEYKKRLYKERVQTASGKKAVMDCNDPVAEELRTLSLTMVYQRVADALTRYKHKRVAGSGVQDAGDDIELELHRMYDHLNPGMQRMNLGNLLRTARQALAAPQQPAA